MTATTLTVTDLNSRLKAAFKHYDGNRRKFLELELECWDMVKSLVDRRPIDLSDPEAEVIAGLHEPLYDWLPELEMDLGELADQQPQYVPQYLAFCEDLVNLIHCPDHNHNFRRSYADALFMSGRLEEAEAVIARLLEEDPTEEWTWYTWADFYLQSKPADKERARAIMEQGKAVPNLQDEGLLDDQLSRLNRRTPATSTKVGRNDPCPCGSGKKAKKCCSS